jgi:hypothetical protein
MMKMDRNHIKKDKRDNKRRKRNKSQVNHNVNKFHKQNNQCSNNVNLMRYLNLQLLLSMA